jgi:hypothetical protein
VMSDRCRSGGSRPLRLPSEADRGARRSRPAPDPRPAEVRDDQGAGEHHDWRKRVGVEPTSDLSRAGHRI